MEVKKRFRKHQPTTFCKLMSKSRFETPIHPPHLILKHDTTCHKTLNLAPLLSSARSTNHSIDRRCAPVEMFFLGYEAVCFDLCYRGYHLEPRTSNFPIASSQVPIPKRNKQANNLPAYHTHTHAPLYHLSQANQSSAVIICSALSVSVQKR